MADDMQKKREAAARRALSPFSDDFKREVGAGMAVLLEQQGVTMEDIDEVQGSYGKRAPSLKDSARLALVERIAKNYPNWDDVKIDNYIQEGTANDFPSQTPERGLPEDQFPPPETLRNMEVDYTLPMQEGEMFPPPQQLRSVTVVDPDEPDESPEPARGGASMGGDEKKKKAPHLERMERMREAFGLDPKY